MATRTSRRAGRTAQPTEREVGATHGPAGARPGTSDTMITHRCWTPVTKRASLWLDPWGPILPPLVTEGTIRVGFGALLPTCFTGPAVEVPG